MNIAPLSLTVISIAILLFAGCESTPRAGGGMADGSREALSGVRYDVDPAWVKETPTSQARAAQYTLPAPQVGIDPAELIFYYFGRNGAGSIEANIDRWVGQFDLGGQSPPAPDVWTRYGLRVHEVSVEGRYVAETTPGSGERHNKPNYAMRAAILETGAGPYYVRLTGPSATVTHWQEAWDRMLRSLRPADVAPEDVDDAAEHPQPSDG